MSMATLEDILPCPLTGKLITRCYKADVCDGRHVVARGGQHRIAQPLLVVHRPPRPRALERTGVIARVVGPSAHNPSEHDCSVLFEGSVPECEAFLRRQIEKDFPELL